MGRLGERVPEKKIHFDGYGATTAPSRKRKSTSTAVGSEDSTHPTATTATAPSEESRAPSPMVLGATLPGLALPRPAQSLQSVFWARATITHTTPFRKVSSPPPPVPVGQDVLT